MSERSAFGRVIDSAWSSKTAGALRTFLPELRPGWWVLRGYLAVAALSIITYEGYYRNPFVPSLSGSYGVGLALTLVAVGLSVMLGRAAMTQPRGRNVSLIVSGLIVVAAFAAVGRVGELYVQTDYSTEYVTPQGLYHQDGTPILNVCPYSSDGKPLAGVLLFDQDGRLIVDAVRQDEHGYLVEPAQPTMIPNAYPLALVRPDPITGEPKPVGCPTILTVPGPTPGG